MFWLRTTAVVLVSEVLIGMVMRFERMVSAGGALPSSSPFNSSTRWTVDFSRYRVMVPISVMV